MRVLLFTGKGGVGTTTVAAATAVRTARAGTKTLLVSLDASGSLPDLLGGPVGEHPHEVEPGLFVVSLTPSAGLAPCPPAATGLAGTLRALLDSPLAAGMVPVLAAEQDVQVLLALRDHVRGGPWDVVVVDCSATSTALRLLALPEGLLRHLDAALPPERRAAEAVRTEPQAAARVDLLQHLESELTSIHDTLTANGTSVRVVTTLEPAAVAVTRRALSALALFDHRPDAVVVNGVLPATSAGDHALLGALRAAADPAPLLFTPSVRHPPQGADALAAVAGPLYDGTAADPLRVPGGRRGMTVRRSGSQFLLELPLPGVNRGDLELGRRGDDLLIALGRHRRRLRLPSVLRRCVAVGASLRDGVLSVRFEPDPTVWRPV